MKEFFIVLILSVLPFGAMAQNGNNWERQGIVTLETTISYNRSHGEEVASSDYLGSGILYAQFNGETMIFKVFVPDDNKSYEVKPNPSYDMQRYNELSQFWYKNRIVDGGPQPRLRCTHKAGPYYLNITKVR